MQLPAQFTPALTGEAAILARDHQQRLRSLPATLQAFIFVELRKWPTLFPAEQRYQRGLLEHLSRLPESDLLQACAGIARIESEAGCDRIARGDPAQFQDAAQALLRVHKLVPAWRKEVDTFFQAINGALESVLYPPDAPRRLIVQLYGSGIAIERAKLWNRFKGTGLRIPLALEDNQESAAFLRGLFGSVLTSVSRSPGFDPLDAWIVETHDALHAVSNANLTGLSYDRLREYREELMRALYSKIQSGVESPQAFAAYARSLKIAPGSGALLNSADIMQAFARDVFLTGNGTIFVNNTFVEWAAVQALRRAQPRVLVTRFGVRHRLKPFSSMLLFSQPRASEQVPAVEDPAGSFIDAEQLSYYVWLSAEKTLAYRKQTLYLFLAEGVGEMLAIRSDKPALPQAPDIASLADVRATMAHWLGVTLPDQSGRAIESLIS